MDKNYKNCYNVYVYCEAKNQLLKNRSDRFWVSFDDVIQEIYNKDFIILESPSRKYKGQMSYIVEINNYPFVCPFHIYQEVVRLITVFPDRRYK